MNCQEVMEYMQRQLDGDLDDQETEILMTHTRHCPNCAAMFSRLQLLSSGLESLPKVTPGYSLVDAIMPRLQELQTAAITPESVLSAGEEEQASAINRRQPRNRTAGWWKDRFSLRALGGVIAAGVVVGLFLVNYHPNNLMRSDNASGNESSKMMTADSKGSLDSAATGSSNSSDAAANKPKADNEVRAEVAEPTSPDKARDKISVTEQFGKSITNSSIDPNGAPLMKHEYKASADTPTDKVASPNYEETETGVTATSDSGTNSSGQDNSNQGLAGANDGMATMKTPAVSMNAPATAFTTSELQATSQDGKYKAFVLDQTLEVFSVDDNVLQFRSDTRPAGITSLVWSPDSKTITYETPAADGKSKLRYTVDIASASEQLQAH